MSTQSFEERLDTVEKQRMELKKIIEQKESSLLEKVDEVKSTVDEAFNLKKNMMKYPVATAGIAAGTGFLLARAMFRQDSNFFSMVTGRLLNIAAGVATGYVLQEIRKLINRQPQPPVYPALKGEAQMNGYPKDDLQKDNSENKS